MNPLEKALGTGILVLLCILPSACVSVKYGTPLVTEGLGSLELGQSTHADILLALGQPRGNGSVHMSQHPDPRNILFYEFIKTDGKNVELEILAVFMRDQHYDGYLWFASSERMRSEGGIPILAPEKFVHGYFPETAPLEDAFVRGQTSREEVLTALGIPTGFGAAILPPEYRAQEVFFYEDVEAGNMQSVAGEIVVDMRQRILLVIFTADIFDGFMWYSNVGVAEGKSQ